MVKILTYTIKFSVCLFDFNVSLLNTNILAIINLHKIYLFFIFYEVLFDFDTFFAGIMPSEVRWHFLSFYGFISVYEVPQESFHFLIIDKNFGVISIFGIVIITMHSIYSEDFPRFLVPNFELRK